MTNRAANPGLSAALTELSTLLTAACGADSFAETLPEDARNFDAGKVARWQDVQLVLASYPRGLPLEAKNALIAKCQSLTKTAGAQPDLSVRVIRMPVFGGHSTREVMRIVQPAPRRRTGLTRDGGGMSVRSAKKPASGAPRAPSIEHLRQLEAVASHLHAALLAQEPGGPRARSLAQQTRHAFAELRAALQARLAHLEQDEQSAKAVRGYRAAVKKVEEIAAGLGSA